MINIHIIATLGIPQHEYNISHMKPWQPSVNNKDNIQKVACFPFVDLKLVDCSVKMFSMHAGIL